MREANILHAARWYPSSPRSWVLKARAQDGGAVLATIQGGQYTAGYTYRVGGRVGRRSTLRRAQRAARKALREASDE